MTTSNNSIPRRSFLRRLSLGAALFTVRGADGDPHHYLAEMKVAREG